MMFSLFLTIASALLITVSKSCTIDSTTVCLDSPTSVEDQFTNIFTNAGTKDFSIEFDGDAECSIDISVFSSYNIELYGSLDFSTYLYTSVTLKIDNDASSMYDTKFNIYNFRLVIDVEPNSNFTLTCNSLIIGRVDSLTVNGDFIIETMYLKMELSSYFDKIKKITLGTLQSPALSLGKLIYNTDFYLDKGLAKINNTEISFIGDIITEIAIESTYDSAYPNFIITSVSVDAPRLNIMRNVNLILKSQVLSDVICAQTSKMILISDIENININIDASDLTLIIQNTNSHFNGVITSSKIILTTEKIDGNINVYFQYLSSNLDIKSSLFVVHAKSLEVSSSSGAPQINFCIGVSRVSQLIVDNNFVINSAFSKINFYVEFDQYKDDSDLVNLINKDWELISAPNAENLNSLASSLAVHYLTNLPYVSGFNSEYNSVTLTVDKTNGYTVKLFVSSVNAFPYMQLIKTQEDVASIVEIIQRGKKKVDVIIDSTYPIIFDFSAINSVIIDNMTIKSISSSKKHAKIIIKPELIINLTLQYIVIDTESIINVNNLQLWPAEPDTNSQVSFGNSIVTSQSGYESKLSNYEFNELILVGMYYNSFQRLTFNDDQIQFGYADSMTISKIWNLTFKGDFSATQLTVNTQNIKGFSIIIIKNAKITLANSWTGVTINPPIEISSDSFQVEISYGYDTILDKNDWIADSEIKYTRYFNGDEMCVNFDINDEFCGTNYNGKSIIDVVFINDILNIKEYSNLKIYLSNRFSVESHPVLKYENMIKLATLTIKCTEDATSFIEISHSSTKLKSAVSTKLILNNLIVKSEQPIEFQKITVDNCDLKDVTSVSAKELNSDADSYSTLHLGIVEKIVLTDTSNSIINGENKPMEFALTGDNNVTFAQNSIKLNEMTINNPGVLTITASNNPVFAIKCETGVSQIPEIIINCAELAEFTYQGSFDSISNGKISITTDSESKHYLYSNSIPVNIEVTETQSIIITAMETEVSISGIVTCRIGSSYSSSYIIVSCDDSLENSTIFFSEIDVAKYYNQDRPIMIIQKTNLLINIESITGTDTNTDVVLYFQYYIDVYGISCVSIKNRNNIPMANYIAFTPNFKNDLTEEQLNLFRVDHSILICDLNNVDLPKNIVITDTDSKQPHGFNQASFAFDIKKTSDNTISFYMKTDPNEIPFVLALSSYGSNSEWEMIIKTESDLANLESILPRSVQAYTIYLDDKLSASTVLNAKTSVFHDKSLKIETAYKMCDSVVRASICNLKSLSLAYVLLTLEDDSKDSVFSKLIIDDCSTINYDFSKVETLIVSVNALATLSNGYVPNEFTLTGKDITIQYSNDGWTFKTSKVSTNEINASEVSGISFIADTKVTIEIKEGTTSLIPLKSILAQETTGYNKNFVAIIGKGWDNIDGEQKVEFINAGDASIVFTVEAASISYPFKFNIDPILIYTVENLPDGFVIDKNVEFKTVDHPIYGSNIVISGTASITVGSSPNKVIFDKLTVKSNSVVAKSDVAVNETLILEPGADYTTDEDVENIDLHWINNKFACFSRNGRNTNLKSIEIIFDGKDNIGYNSLLYGKDFTIVKAYSSSYCGWYYKDVATFVSQIPDFNGTESIFDMNCDGSGNLVLHGAREINEVQQNEGSSLFYESNIDNEHSSHQNEDTGVKESSNAQSNDDNQGYEEQSSLKYHTDIDEENSSHKQKDGGYSSIQHQGGNDDEQSSLVSNDDINDEKSSFQQEVNDESSQQHQGGDFNEASSTQHHGGEEDKENSSQQHQKDENEISSEIQEGSNNNVKQSDTNENQGEEPEDSSKTAIIAGSVVGAIIVVVIIFVVVILLARRKKFASSSSSKNYQFEQL